MDRVGGFVSWKALLADAQAYDDIMIVMAAESDVAAVLASRRAAAEARARRG